MGRPTDWNRLADEGALAACVRDSAQEIYGYVGLLAGHDRGGAEDVVRTVYAALAREVAAGRTDSVSLARLRTAARRLWLGRERVAVISQVAGPVSDRPVVTLAELSDAERTVMVLLSVNKMPVESIATTLQLSPDQIAEVEQRAVRRLGGDVGQGLRPWFGDAVKPRPGFVDDLVAHATVSLPADESADAPPVAPVRERPVEPVAATAPVVAAAPRSTAPVPPPPVIDDPDDDDLVDDGGGRGKRVFVVLAVFIAAIVAGALAVALTRGNDDEAATETTVGATADGSTVPGSTTPTTPAQFTFAPACTEQPAATSAVSAPQGANLTDFGPIGAKPALTVALPSWNGADGVVGANTDAFRLPGGVLVVVRSPDAAPVAASVLARVDFDGTVRWVRCFDERIEIRPRTVENRRGAAVSQGDGWAILTIDDGQVGAEIDEPAPVDRAPWVAAQRWPDDQLATIEWDGFQSGVAGDIAIVLGCSQPDATAENGCAKTTLRGYNRDSRQMVWERDDVSDVAFVRGTSAVIKYTPGGSEGAWYMIDVADGSAIDGQVWAADTFPSPCCNRLRWSQADGGVVFVRQADQLAVFLSAAAQVTPATASLAE